MKFSLEPDFALCRFKVRGGHIDVEVYPNASRSNPVRFSGLKKKVLHSLYKSLRDLESLDCWKHPECDKVIWSWGFPHQELDRYQTELV